jgi:hypothetical protein
MTDHVLQIFYADTFFSEGRGERYPVSKEVGTDCIRNFNKTGAFLLEIPDSRSVAYVRGAILKVELISLDEFNAIQESQRAQAAEASSE